MINKILLGVLLVVSAYSQSWRSNGIISFSQSFNYTQNELTETQQHQSYKTKTVLFQGDAGQYEEEDANTNLSIPKKVIFLILSIITLIGMIVLLVKFGKKFR
jgi:hypothetical protein